MILSKKLQRVGFSAQVGNTNVWDDSVVSLSLCVQWIGGVVTELALPTPPCSVIVHVQLGFLNLYLSTPFSALFS